MEHAPRTAGQQTGSTYILTGLCSLAAILLLALVAPDYFQHDRGDADIMNDWVVASAFLDGVSPYSELDGLADHYSGDRYTPPTLNPRFEGIKRTPRTPGAIALSSLWVPIPLDGLVLSTNLLGALVLVPMTFLAIRPNHPSWLMLSVFLFLTAAMGWSIRYGTITPLVALASTFAIVGIKDGDRPKSGIAIAVAATMKAFPLILLILAAAHRRWRTFRWAIGSLLALNLIPLVTPHLSLKDALDALLGASARYGFSGNLSYTRMISEASNSSVGIMVFAAVIISVAWWVTAYPSNVATDAAVVVGTAILFSPLSWPHYALVFYPVALLFLFTPTVKPATKTVAAASLLLAFPTGELWIGPFGILIFTIVAVIQRFRLSPLRRPLLAPVSAR